jgi:hypothetical protein
VTTRRLLLALCLVLAALPVAAQAKGGDPEVRTSARCGNGTTADLRLRVRDGGIQARFEVQHGRSGAWNVVLVHERRIGWKGSLRSSGSSRSFEIERTLPDFPGSDSVTARATGPKGALCQLTAVVPDGSGGDGGGQQGGDDS